MDPRVPYPKDPVPLLTMQGAVPAPGLGRGGGLGFSSFRWPPARQSKAQGHREGPLALLGPSQLTLAKIS